MYSFVVHLFLVPPINFLLLTIVGFFMLLCGRLAGRWLVGIGITCLILLALPVVSGTLLFLLECPPRSERIEPQAIVILGGDAFFSEGQQSTGEIGELTLERLRAGAALQHLTHLPVLTTGGSLEPKMTPLGDLMAQSLKENFSVEPRWTESASRDTWENAQDSAAILKAAGIHSIYLVTHAWHMRRALIAFSHVGLAVTPAPVPAANPPAFDLENFVPNASAWQTSYYALHEWIGCAWYTLRARF